MLLVNLATLLFDAIFEHYVSTLIVLLYKPLHTESDSII